MGKWTTIYCKIDEYRLSKKKKTIIGSLETEQQKNFTECSLFITSAPHEKNSLQISNQILLGSLNLNENLVLHVYSLKVCVSYNNMMLDVKLRSRKKNLWEYLIKS